MRKILITGKRFIIKLDLTRRCESWDGKFDGEVIPRINRTEPNWSESVRFGSVHDLPRFGSVLSKLAKPEPNRPMLTLDSTSFYLEKNHTRDPLWSRVWERYALKLLRLALNTRGCQHILHWDIKSDISTPESRHQQWPSNWLLWSSCLKNTSITSSDYLATPLLITTSKGEKLLFKTASPRLFKIEIAFSHIKCFRK